MNPYPGLRPFRKDEAHLFFGRESQVDAMVDKLAATRFLAVVGTSGSGKSSLVNCGLRPALHLGIMASAGTAWRIADFRPGKTPIRKMAEALAAPGVLYSGAAEGPFSMAEIVESSLRMSKLGLFDVFEQAHLPEHVNLLVVADQFEELFRYSQVGATDEAPRELSDEAIAFVNLLLAAREESPSRIYIVLTMRSDFLGDCAQFYGLPEAINQGQYLVPRMTRDERRRAIAGPAGFGGAEIDPVLLTRLVNDVGSNPDQLSILQHALHRTWAQWEADGAQGKITLDHYVKIGTMDAALDQHAEEAFGKLEKDRLQPICAKMFKALTDKATDARGTRRPTEFSTLRELTEATPKELTDIMTVFRDPTRSFLMPPHGEALNDETVVDISHESLMRVWRRLRDWSDEEARSAATFRRLSETAALQAAGRASLWQGPDLDEALAWRSREQPNGAWAKRYAKNFVQAMSFLDASVAERAEAQKRETDRLKAKERLQRVATLAVSALVLIIVVLAAALALRDAKAREDLLEAQKDLLEAKNRTAGADGIKQFLAKIETDEQVDTQTLQQSFKAYEQISTLTATAQPNANSDITIEYFRKPVDSERLLNSLKELGFTVTERRANNPNPTNCLWYGPEIKEEEVKLVAYAIMRAGIDLRAIEPRIRGPRVIQVGRAGIFERYPPFTVEEVKAKPLGELRRERVATTPNS